MASAQAPPLLRDLPALAATWPPAWGPLVRDVAAAPDFEEKTLKRVDSLLKAEKPAAATYRIAEVVLSAALRHSLSERRAAPLAVVPSSDLAAKLATRLEKLRADWLLSLREDQAAADALADRWLPTAAREGPLRTAILDCWTQTGKAALNRKDFAAARATLDRIEAHFDQIGGADEIDKALRERAEALQKQASAMPDAKAVQALEEALTLWPRLPDAQDTLARHKGTFRTLLVAVPALPEQLSPSTAYTSIDRQALELVFDRLFRVEYPAAFGKRYRPQLALDLPADGLAGSIQIRRDVFWSSGERLTSADIRHTALLMNQPDAAGRTALWREVLELPQSGANRFRFALTNRHGLFDPLAAAQFWILPQYYRGKQLQRADDADFAKAPVGSGPFRYLGVKRDQGTPHAVFQSNSRDLRRPIAAVREIRMMPWSDARKDFPRPAPHLVLDAPTQQRAALQQLGYAEINPGKSACVHLLAVNHRRPTLASVAVRRALALAIDRQALLDRHFRAEPKKDHATANGLFPRHSWASAPAPGVPMELFNLENARSLARQVKTETNVFDLTLKYPAGDPRVKSACEEIAAGIVTLFQDAKIKIGVKAIPLSTHVLQKAIRDRDYDLLYTTVESLDDPIRLAFFFDRQEDATRAGGSNYLGYDNDARLHELLREVTRQRQFAALQANMRAVHAHLTETMPAIPLWQLDFHVLVHPSLRTPRLDPRAVFANVRDWQIEK